MCYNERVLSALVRPSHACHLLGRDHLILTQVGRAGSLCFFSADEFFSQSCAPGADPKSSLCALCAGDDQGLNKCVPNSKEKYYGYTGAFRWVLWPGFTRTGPWPSASRVLAHHIPFYFFLFVKYISFIFNWRMTA